MFIAVLKVFPQSLNTFHSAAQRNKQFQPVFPRGISLSKTKTCCCGIKIWALSHIAYPFLNSKAVLIGIQRVPQRAWGAKIC